MEEARITLLGVRGSAPVDGAEYARYGGASACVLCRMGGQMIVLDAGTGILKLKNLLRHDERSLHILLSHPHIDHILGLPACPVLYDLNYSVSVYAAERGGFSAREQVCALMSDPLWPTGPDSFSAEVSFHTLPLQFAIGPVQISLMRGAHPGGCAVIRLDYLDKSLVYATDFEHGGEDFDRLSDFAAGCSLLLYDAQYTAEEYEERRGWGHSTWEMGMKAAQLANARRTVFIHHDPFRDDAALDALGKKAAALDGACSFGKSGEEIVL